MKRQPSRDTYRDHKTVTCIACRALVSAVQTHLTTCPVLSEEEYPFLTKLLGVPSNSQRSIPRNVVALHLRLNEAETLPVVPFGHRDSHETSRLAGWLAVGWLASWLAGWLAGWQAGWLAGWQAGWLAGRLAGWQAGWLAGWQAGWLVLFDFQFKMNRK